MKYFGLLLGLFLFVLPLLSFAQSQPLTPSGQTGRPSLTPSGQTGSLQGPAGGSFFEVKNPLQADSIAKFIEQVLKAVIIIGIPVAVLFIVFAGFKFVIAMGKPEALTEAKRNLGYTVVGIGLFLAAWLIAQVIFNTVNRLGA